MLRTYLVISPSSYAWELRESEWNSRFSPPAGFNIIVRVTVFVELVLVEDVGVTSAFGVVMKAFVGPVLLSF